MLADSDDILEPDCVLKKSRIFREKSGNSTCSR